MRGEEKGWGDRSQELRVCLEGGFALLNAANGLEKMRTEAWI